MRVNVRLAGRGSMQLFANILSNVNFFLLVSLV